MALWPLIMTGLIVAQQTMRSWLWNKEDLDREECAEAVLQSMLRLRQYRVAIAMGS